MTPPTFTHVGFRPMSGFRMSEHLGSGGKTHALNLDPKNRNRYLAICGKVVARYDGGADIDHVAETSEHNQKCITCKACRRKLGMAVKGARR